MNIPKDEKKLKPLPLENRNGRAKRTNMPAGRLPWSPHLNANPVLKENKTVAKPPPPASNLLTLLNNARIFSDVFVLEMRGACSLAV